jgi:hypothetical protein
MSHKRLRELKFCPQAAGPPSTAPAVPPGIALWLRFFTYGAAGRKVRARILKVCQSWPHWLSGVDQ